MENDKLRATLRDVNNGIVKPAESTDNPEDIMAAALPRLSQMGAVERLNVLRPVPCPICGYECSVRPDLLREAMKIYPGRLVAVCSECAIRGNRQPGLLPAWLIQHNLTPDQALALVMNQSEDMRS